MPALPTWTHPPLFGGGVVPGLSWPKMRPRPWLLSWSRDPARVEAPGCGSPSKAGGLLLRHPFSASTQRLFNGLFNYDTRACCGLVPWHPEVFIKTYTRWASQESGGIGVGGCPPEKGCCLPAGMGGTPVKGSTPKWTSLKYFS